MTIYDIADEAGVSASTVSRVLNQKKGVSQHTRQRVEKLLQKYSFRPNATAQGLVNQSSKIIGIMMSDIRTSHHAEGAYFIEQQMQQHGYSCIIINCGFSNQSRVRALQSLAARQVEAVVLIGSTFQTDSIRRGISTYLKDLPIIFENGFFEQNNVYSILADEENGIAACLRLLVQKGKNHLYFINMHETPSNQLKMKGFSTEWRKNFCSVIPPAILHIPDGFSEVPLDECDEWEAAYQATLQLMLDHPETDGLIFSTDLLAHAGVQALLDCGKRIPEDVAVIGVDDSLYAKICRPKLTTLNNQMKNLSVECSELLLKVLQGKSIPPKKLIFSNIVERETT